MMVITIFRVKCFSLTKTLHAKFACPAKFTNFVKLGCNGLFPFAHGLRVLCDNAVDSSAPDVASPCYSCFLLTLSVES